MAGRSLAARLKQNEDVLLAAYRTIAKAGGEGRAITPAAEWLLDNYHLVEEQIRKFVTICHRATIELRSWRRILGPFPRVFGVAWAFVLSYHSASIPRFCAVCARVPRVQR